MTTESEVKRKIVKSMHDNGGYARRVEDQYAVGTYDMILIPMGLPVFMAEVKMITGRAFGPTPRQHIELLRIDSVADGGGHVYPVVIGYKDGFYYFSPPKATILMQDCFSVTTSTMTFYHQLVQYYHSRKE